MGVGGKGGALGDAGEAILKSLPTHSLRVAGIADPSPLAVFRRKTGINKYRRMRRALRAGRLGAPARSGICREALGRVFTVAAVNRCTVNGCYHLGLN